MSQRLGSVGLRMTMAQTSAARQSVRGYNFASNSYAACFGKLPAAESAAIRAASVEYIKKFNARAWYDDPVCTLLEGKEYREGRVVETVNAFNEQNGKLILSPSDVVDKIIDHMHNYRPPKTDYRKEMREIEQKLLSPHFAAMLVGNQALDFMKQDGITEMEEAVEANTVERRLNDLVYEDELAGHIAISRAPALVGCVSNFSNFLDLFRKTLRNIELGVPAVVLSRGNTTQHMFRWAQILADLMKEHNVDAGLLTYASCDVEMQRRIMKSNPGSPLQFTGSRAIAAAIKEVCPLLMASTGGPNTMVAGVWTPAIAEAVRMSAAIENSGQCTALRHLVAPGCTPSDIAEAFAKQAVVECPSDSLAAKEFSAIFKKHPFKLLPGYTAHPSGQPIAYKVTSAFPGDDLDEMWRQVYVDVTSVDESHLASQHFVDSLSAWLVQHQPISLAVNGGDFPSSFELARKLFERTGMVVYTVGSAEKPALTAQARPQDAEIFGEFPPRRDLAKYTRFPVVGPSSSPGYNAFYTGTHLAEQAKAPCTPGLELYEGIISGVGSEHVRGYLRIMANYMSEAASGPREGHGARTALWGLQRPPMDGTKSFIRCEANTSFDDLAVDLLPFAMTNARSQIEVSVDPNNTAVAKQLASMGVTVDVKHERRDVFLERVEEEKPWNVIYPQACDFVLVGHQVSLLFPLGHIKCTRGNDREFVDYFKASDKWLRVLTQ